MVLMPLPVGSGSPTAPGRARIDRRRAHRCDASARRLLDASLASRPRDSRCAARADARAAALRAESFGRPRARQERARETHAGSDCCEDAARCIMRPEPTSARSNALACCGFLMVWSVLLHLRPGWYTMGTNAQLYSLLMNRARRPSRARGSLGTESVDAAARPGHVTSRQAQKSCKKAGRALHDHASGDLLQGSSPRRPSSGEGSRSAAGERWMCMACRARLCSDETFNRLGFHS